MTTRRLTTPFLHPSILGRRNAVQPASTRSFFFYPRSRAKKRAALSHKAACGRGRPSTMQAPCTPNLSRMRALPSPAGKKPADCRPLAARRQSCCPAPAAAAADAARLEARPPALPQPLPHAEAAASSRRPETELQLQAVCHYHSDWAPFCGSQRSDGSVSTRRSCRAPRGQSSVRGAAARCSSFICKKRERLAKYLLSRTP